MKIHECVTLSSCDVIKNKPYPINVDGEIVSARINLYREEQYNSPFDL